MFNVIIIGGEHAPSYDFFQKECIKLLRNKAKSGERIRVLTIGDENVEKFTSTFGIETKTFNCDWKKDGKNALFLRNKEIVSEGDAIIYFDTNKKDLDVLYDYATKCHLLHRRIEINP